MELVDVMAGDSKLSEPEAFVSSRAMDPREGWDGAFHRRRVEGGFNPFWSLGRGQHD